MTAFGDVVRADCGAPARYLHDGLCLWISAMDNDVQVSRVHPTDPTYPNPPVLPDMDMCAAASAALHYAGRFVGA